eukprot:XP_001691756.1 histone methyltransferase [Chlamydomonas reinhardtii]
MMNNRNFGFSPSVTAIGCKAAAAAWQAYAARLTRDISGGQEQLPVPVDPPPHTSRTAPLPLDTRYTRDSVHGAAAVGDIPSGQGGCCASCTCCRQQLDDAVDQNSLGKSLLGEGKAHASATDAAAPAAKRPRRCNNDDSSSSRGATGRRSCSGSSGSSEESDGEGWSCCGCGVLMPAGVRAYQPNGRGLKPELLAQASAAAFILECGPACACRHPAQPAHSTRGAIALVDAGIGDDTATPPGCVLGCAARLTQHGLAARVRLSWVPGKGWAAFAAEPLPAGAFVCRYEGELLRSGEAERRLRHVYDCSSSSRYGSSSGSSSRSSSGSGSTGAGFYKEEGEEVERKEVGRATDACVRGQGDRGGGGAGRQRPRIGGDGGTREGGDSADGAGAGEGHALLVVREVLPSGLALRLNIDATRLGNVARFFNHSCDGGCLLPVVVRRRGSLVPGVGLFARRDISVGEELTFPYAL